MLTQQPPSKRQRTALNGINGEHTGDDDRTPQLGWCVMPGCNNRAAIAQDDRLIVCFACHDDVARERNEQLLQELNDLAIDEPEPLPVQHACACCGLAAPCTTEDDCECLSLEYGGVNLTVCGTQCAYIILAAISALNGANGEATGSDDVGRGGKGGKPGNRADRKNPAGKGKGSGPQKAKFVYVCKICNVPGHHIKECPEAVAKTPGVCYECDKPGHKAIECPEVAAAAKAEADIWTARMKSEAAKTAAEPSPKATVKAADTFRETKVMGSDKPTPVADLKTSAFLASLRTQAVSGHTDTTARAPKRNRAHVLAHVGKNVMDAASIGYTSLTSTCGTTTTGDKDALPVTRASTFKSMLAALTAAAPGTNSSGKAPAAAADAGADTTAKPASVTAATTETALAAAVAAAATATPAAADDAAATPAAADDAAATPAAAGGAAAAAPAAADGAAAAPAAADGAAAAAPAAAAADGAAAAGAAPAADAAAAGAAAGAAAPPDAAAPAAAPVAAAPAAGAAAGAAAVAAAGAAAAPAALAAAPAAAAGAPLADAGAPAPPADGAPAAAPPPGDPPEVAAFDVAEATAFFKIENEKRMKRLMTANNIRDKMRALLMTKDLDSKADRKNAMMLCMNIARKADGYSNDMDTASVVAEIFEEELPNVVRMRGVLANAVRDSDSAVLGDLDYLNWLRFKSASFGRKFGIVAVAEGSTAGGGCPSNIAPIAALLTVVAETAAVRYIGGIFTRHMLCYARTYLSVAIKTLAAVAMPVQALEQALGIAQPKGIDIRVEPDQLVEHVAARAAAIGRELYHRSPTYDQLTHNLPSGAEVRNRIRSEAAIMPERLEIRTAPEGFESLYRARGYPTSRPETDSEYRWRTGYCALDRFARRTANDAVEWANTPEDVTPHVRPPPYEAPQPLAAPPLRGMPERAITGVATVVLPVLLTTVITFCCNWLAAGVFCDLEKWYRPNVDDRTKFVHRLNAATACYGWTGFFGQIAFHFCWNTMAGLFNRRELMADITSSRKIYTTADWKAAQMPTLCLETYRVKDTPTQAKFRATETDNPVCEPKLGYTRMFSVAGFSSTVYSGCHHCEKTSLTARVGKNLPIHETPELAAQCLLNGRAWPMKCYLGLQTAKQAKLGGSSKVSLLMNGVATFQAQRRPQCCASGTPPIMIGFPPLRPLSSEKKPFLKVTTRMAFSCPSMTPRTLKTPA